VPFNLNSVPSTPISIFPRQGGRSRIGLRIARIVSPKRIETDTKLRFPIAETNLMNRRTNYILLDAHVIGNDESAEL
jgi:hypothetical protein